MKLTQYSNYALRTLMFANLHSDRLCQCQEVADAFQISKSHLVKCGHQVGRWGFVHSVRGRKGGFRLARPAHEITVGAVIRKTEDSLDLVECFSSKTNGCPLITGCRLNRLFTRAMAGFMGEMDRVTIEDITANQKQLLALLNR